MIAYTMVGTHHLERARGFYDAVFAELGRERCFGDDQVTAWGDPSDESVPRFFAGYPFDGVAAGVGNGAMTAFHVADSARIDRLYAIALRHGGTSEGAPGPRPQYSQGFYAAYVRDPDGNKLAFVCYDCRAGAPDG